MTAQPITEIDIADDDALRFVQRVLESNAPESDRAAARDMVVAIRTRVRKVYATALASPKVPELSDEQINDLARKAGLPMSWLDDGKASVWPELNRFARAVLAAATPKEPHHG
jgi:hypothetical protein